MSSLNTESIELIRRVGGAPLVERIVETFFERSLERLAGIQEGVSAGDREITEYWAHSMRSGALIVGAADLADQAEKIETTAGKIDLSDLRRLLLDLERLFSRVEKELREYLDE